MKELLIVSLIGVAVLGLDVLRLRKLVYPLIALALLAVCGVVWFDWNAAQDPFNNGMLRFDNFALAFTAAFALLSLFWLVFSRNAFGSGEKSVDLYALALFSLCGAMVLTSYQNMVMLFLGVEILSIPVYVLAASKRGNQLSNEAGFKYFFLGAVASAILLLGIALLYGATGSFDLSEIRNAITAGESMGVMLLAGLMMLLAGFAFKISVVPFHFWAPDVYQGSPTMVTAFMSTIVKGAAFAGLIRFFLLALPAEVDTITTAIAWMSGL
ncbi:MAG: NADH-quinone oxidoreductase subunit N, partial [Flavobacteriales bacterium]|nr:NADH-quinone oxidoreductase subunit N [Flavobacteriales bacterium]